MSIGMGIGEYIVQIIYMDKYIFWESLYIIIGIGSKGILENKYEELASEEIEGKIKGIIGYKGLKYIVILMGVLMWTLFQNWIGLIGYSGGGNSGLVFCNIIISMLIFIYVTYRGVEERGVEYSDVFIPYSAPLWIRPFMSLIETISYSSRVVSLCTRLTANIYGGHILTGVISKFLSYMRDMVSISGQIILCVLVGLELSVGFLQSYVYSILIIIYLKDVYNSH